MKNREILVDAPNFTAVLPGTCNANCDFCFWSREDQGGSVTHWDFAKKLAGTLDSLPADFWQISLSGGEPTISPVFDEVINVIRSRRNKFSKVVLTTNGVRLAEKSSVIRGVVDHINISRHAVDDDENLKRFRSLTVPTGKEIEGLVNLDYGNADVSLNCVISRYTFSPFCLDYVLWARRLGVKAVNFRIESGSLDACIAEAVIGLAYGGQSSGCPVCRTTHMLVDDFPINWKYSLEEPSHTWKGIYELIMQPNGELTVDWEGKDKASPEEIQTKKGKDKEMSKQSNRELAERLITLAEKLLEDGKQEEMPIRSSHEYASVKNKITDTGCNHGGGC